MLVGFRQVEAIVGPARLAAFLIATAFTIDANGEPAASQTPVTLTVRLVSGRVFTAAVDRKTDDQTLWLRFDRPGATFLRPVKWNAVRQANVGGATISGEELRTRAAELASPRPVRILAGASPAFDSDDLGQESVRAPTRLRSLQLDAGPANWDADVEDDGILLRIFPLDGDGQVTAADGTLDVDLIGDAAGATSRGQDFTDLGRWTRRLQPAAVGPNGAVFRLEYQSIHPEFFTQTSPYGLVHARLSAPGHGAFEATTGVLRLRPYNGPRDRRQQAAGTRFFPVERTRRGVRLDPETGF